MKIVRHIVMLILSQVLLTGSHGQDNSVLTAEEFIAQVKLLHPVAKQANLVTAKADAELLAARGAFDPVFNMGSENKSLDGVSYYHYNNPELKIPTRLGVNVKGGFERASGQFLNPETTRGVASYVGIELPLLNGLVTDKQRTALQQAKIFRELSEQERMAMINDLLLNAYISYWEWAGSYQLYKIYEKFMDVADRRTRLVSIAYRNGDRAMADTIEAFAQLQYYRLLQSDALIELNKKRFELSTYLWSQNGAPILLPDGFIPDSSGWSHAYPVLDTTGLISNLSATHPLLQAGQFKLDMLEAERKLKLQNLLPTVNLQANILSKDYFEYKNFSNLYLQNNYKLGIYAKFPLLLRQGRGEYKNIKLKIRDNSLDLSNKTSQLQNKLRQYYTESIQLQAQIASAASMNNAYRALLNAEELRFGQGESSLFLINSRENKVLEMQQKMIELRVKQFKAIYSFRWASGSID